MDNPIENLDLDLDINEMIKNALCAAMSSIQIGYLNKIGVKITDEITANVNTISKKQVAKLLD